MQSIINMSNIFDKLNDLKNLFKFGERIVPIIQSLIEFMKEIVPLLENINTSISDTANKMPQAANQIDSVTSATELATTEILDLVDKIGGVVMELEQDMKGLQEQKTRKTEIVDTLKQTLGGNSDALALLDELMELDEVGAVAEKAATQLAQINDANYQITLSLQVQDITAQQLAAVNHLINSVHGKLATLISDIDMSDIKDGISDLDIEAPEGATFDPKASYKKDDRQSQADDIINSATGSSGGGVSSQADIDALFGGGGSPAEETPTESGGAMSGDDINALFSGQGTPTEEPKTPASQDDVDALLNAQQQQSEPEEKKQNNQEEIDNLLNQQNDEQENKEDSEGEENTKQDP